MSIKVTRTVAGLSLPVNCFIRDGFPIGSCNYTNQQICRLSETGFPVGLGLYLASTISNILGNDCDGLSRQVPIDQVLSLNEMVDFEARPDNISFLSFGDFQFKIVVTEGTKKAFCGTFRFGVNRPPLV